MKHLFEIGKYFIVSDYPMDMDEICFVLFTKDLDEISELKYDLCEQFEADMKKWFRDNPPTPEFDERAHYLCEC